MSILDSDEKWSAAVYRCAIYVRACSDQDTDSLEGTFADSQQQRSQPAHRVAASLTVWARAHKTQTVAANRPYHCRLSMDVDALFQKEPDDVSVALLCGPHQSVRAA